MKIFAPLVLATAASATGYTYRTQNWASTDCTGTLTSDSTFASDTCIGGFQYYGSCRALGYYTFLGMAAITCSGSPAGTFPPTNAALLSGVCQPNPVTGGSGKTTCTCTDAACRAASAGSRASLLAPTAWLVVATAAAAHLGTSIH
jgi:hypothetical protein